MYPPFYFIHYSTALELVNSSSIKFQWGPFSHSSVTKYLVQLDQINQKYSVRPDRIFQEIKYISYFGPVGSNISDDFGAGYFLARLDQIYVIFGPDLIPANFDTIT